MDKYPYALSNIVIAAYIILNIFIGFLFLEETHPDFKGRRDYGLELGDLIRTGLGYEVPIRPWKSEGLSRTQSNVTDNNSSVLEIESIDERTPLHHSHTSPRAFYNDQDVEDDALSTRSDDSVQSTNFLSKRASNAIVRRYSEIPQLHLTRTNTRDPDAVSIFTFQEGVEAGEFLKDEVLFPFTIREKFSISEVAWFSLALLAFGGFIQSLFLKDYDEDLKAEDEP
ncbi:hypothetical protein QCA50_010016 [Cerrena zonata]|uniref:Uncharacterized protein n=1 Tax=Cerrena zonata TaxID=2478898 RepID=A0AAW0GAH4_9APHY